MSYYIRHCAVWWKKYIALLIGLQKYMFMKGNETLHINKIDDVANLMCWL